MIMKKLFNEVLVEMVLFDEKDIITTSGLISSAPETEESTPYESETVFVPGSNGFHGEDIPLG